MKTDVLILGSGAAGLSTAINIAKSKLNSSITIVTKSTIEESNTKYAQGGIAGVLDNDDFSIEQHISDTISAGAGVNNPDVVDFIVRNAAIHLNSLIEYGADFDKSENGDYEQIKEGGHKQKIILHRKDSTGEEIESTLVDQVKKYKNIKVLENHFAIDIILENSTCVGVSVVDLSSNIKSNISSKFVVIATGGIGELYDVSTNPSISTGDGIAIAARAGAKIKGIEFIQFHPTVLFQADEKSNFLISEAVRGHGAKLLNSKGERFVFDYDERGELATRDVVSRAIYEQMSKTKSFFIWLDARDIPNFEVHFPLIFDKCMLLGINPQNNLIPVTPGAHYSCGGVDVNLKGETSITNLYACGEASYTGFHGANRLASNSLLEAIVFADEIAKSIVSKVDKVSVSSFSKDDVFVEVVYDNLNQRKKLQAIMQKYVSIIRTDVELEIALTEIKRLKSIIDSCCFELHNMLEVAELIVKHSKKRKENLGCFYKK